MCHHLQTVECLLVKTRPVLPQYPPRNKLSPNHKRESSISCRLLHKMHFPLLRDKTQPVPRPMLVGRVASLA